MNKTIWILAIAAAFIVGTIATGAMVEAAKPAAPLTQILIIDKQGSNTITATSSSDFIVTFCAVNSVPTTDDLLTINRGGGSTMVVLDIDTGALGGNCATVGGSAGGTVTAQSSASDGITVSTAVMQTRDSATASLT